MEALTAITVLLGRHTIGQVTAAITGQPELGDLARELFQALVVSEDRLVGKIAGIEQRLARIEHRLDEVLDQHYDIALGTGVRGLLDAATAAEKNTRDRDLTEARQRFLEAAAASRSSLQRAVAERYLMLCAIALGRHDAAVTAWHQLNRASIVAAREVQSAVGRSFGQPSEWNEEIVMVENLLIEAGSLGQLVGRPAPFPIHRSDAHTLFSPMSSMGATPTWNVVSPSFISDAGLLPRSPVRVGGLVVTWDRLDIVPGTLRLRSGDSRYPYGVQVHVDFKVEADMALPVFLPVATRTDTGGIEMRMLHKSNFSSGLGREIGRRGLDPGATMYREFERWASTAAVDESGRVIWPSVVLGATFNVRPPIAPVRLTMAWYVEGVIPEQTFDVIQLDSDV